jgi:predicted nucleic acid-binding Zn ribbon protein
MCTTKTPSHRQCVICNKQLYGRSDKRFCDIKCKNYYHSEVRKSTKTITSETLKILSKNVVILYGILGEEKDSCLIDKLALERLGFHFNYVTDAESKYGVFHYSVFDFTYRIVKKKRVLITVDKKRKTVSPFIFKRWSREISEQPDL